MKLVVHSLSVHEHISGTAGLLLWKFLCRSPVVMAQSSFGGVAIHYVLPALWMMSRLADSGVAIRGVGV